MQTLLPRNFFVIDSGSDPRPGSWVMTEVVSAGLLKPLKAERVSLCSAWSIDGVWDRVKLQ